MTPTYPTTPPQPDPRLVRRIQKLAFRMIGTEPGRDFWLTRPNPELGGSSPADLIAAGHGEVVERYLRANLNGVAG